MFLPVFYSRQQHEAINIVTTVVHFLCLLDTFPPAKLFPFIPQHLQCAYYSYSTLYISTFNLTFSLSLSYDTHSLSSTHVVNSRKNRLCTVGCCVPPVVTYHPYIAILSMAALCLVSMYHQHKGGYISLPQRYTMINKTQTKHTRRHIPGNCLSSLTLRLLFLFFSHYQALESPGYVLTALDD